MSKYTLGLDMGANSLGWAIIGNSKDEQPTEIVDCGTRIFQEALDAKTKVSKNQARRTARAMRRQVARHKMRRNAALRYLTNNNLLPADQVELKKILTDNKRFDPYQLRKKALDEKLQLCEIGRIIYHLAQRRGFQSNRKVSSPDDGIIIKSISELKKEIENSNSRTLGEYLANQQKKRGLYTDRDMYKEEFEKIWENQQNYYPDVLTPAYKVILHKLIFFQRPLKLQKYLIGKCSFEPSRKRVSKALLEYQRFRILQDINNLKIKDTKTRDYRSLDSDEYKKLIDVLERQKTISWNKARTILGLHGGEIFNLEEGGKRELIGNRTAYAVRSKIGDKWDGLPEKEQKELITDILTINDENGLLNRMKQHWGFDEKTAEAIAKIELESGYASLSLKAINKILPYLGKSMRYDEACIKAGYNHSNIDNAKKIVDELKEPPYLRNPLVQKALYEVRKVVNAIIRKHGKPSRITIEMARKMKLSKKQKEKLSLNMRDREKKNNSIKAILQNDFGIQNPYKEDIQKYQLWEECGAVCPYTGDSISREMLFSQEVDIEHILPYSKSLDDSYWNKTLCIAKENRQIKHNKSPYEAYSADSKKYEEILKRVEKLPWNKRKKFEQKNIDTDKFIERQLNDTRYISTEVKKYLFQLGTPVNVTKGEATSVLRHRWKLNMILSVDGNKKNREDHRHHTIDAIVIALTSRSLFQKLSKLSAESGKSLSEHGFNIDAPWHSFYKDVDEKIQNIIVSHSPTRKITGAFHEETAYGYNEKEDYFVYRKPLSGITKAQVEKIIDKKVRQLVEERINNFNGDFKKALSNSSDPLFHVDGKTNIRSVRIASNFNRNSVYGIRDNAEGEYKFYKYGNNHHVEIIEDMQTKKRKGIFVTAMEAARRARIDKTSIVNRNHGDKYKFIASLAINDLVEIDMQDEKRYYRVQMLDGSNQRITLRLHTAATLDDKKTMLVGSANRLLFKKIMVDTLGCITYCND